MQKPISAGTVISHRYQVQKKIHDTVFNTCYLAEDSENSNRLVMLSLPRIELLIFQDFTTTFDQLCKKLMSPTQSGLLKVLGCGEHESQPYAVLQYVTDETLEHVLSRHLASEAEVDLDSVLDWATPLAVTLDELHQAGYVHGSVKPSSVYIGSQKVLLGDFITEYTLQSLGKFKNGITTLNIDEYLSPEYLKSSYTAHYDQYLLANMVYEALAGKVPFARSKGGDDYRMQVATHVSPLLTAHRPELKAVSDVLAKAMKRKPTDRYKSCRAFLSALQEAQGAEPAKPPPQKKVVITTPFSDDPEDDEEEIITSIRKDQKSSGGKKGLLWLSVLFITGGAAAFTAINYPQVFGLGDQQTASNEAKPVVVPVSVSTAANIAEPKVSDAEAKDTKVDEVKVVEKEPEPSVDEVVSDTAIKQESANEKVVEEFLSEKTEVPQSQEANGSNAVINAETSTELNRVINQALLEGHESFKEAKAAEANLAARDEALERAVTEALLRGHDEFLSQAATDALAALSEPAVDQSASTQEASPVVAGAEVGESSDTTTDANLATPVAPTSPENADSQIQQAEVAAVEAATPPETAVAQAIPAPEEAAAPVDAATAKQLQMERIQAIKQQKLARIKSVTDDCTIGGKIHRETAAGNLPYVKNCMSVGVSPNLKQNNGWSLLHIAARNGDLNLCKLLIAQGAVVNDRAKNGQTALAMAVALRKERVAAYLRTRGAVN